MPIEDRSLVEWFAEVSLVKALTLPGAGRTVRDRSAPDLSARRDRAPPADAEVLAAARQALPREFVALYHSIEALRTGDSAIVLQFAGASGREDSGTVASGFARVAGTVAGSRSVLYVDCRSTAGHRGDAPLAHGLIEAFLSGSSPADATKPARGAAGVSWAWLGVAACGPADLARMLTGLRQRFALVVLDCPEVGATASPEMMSLARHCDGTVLVVDAKRTRTRAVAASRETIERLGGQVVGTVFNSRRSGRWPRWFAGR